MIIDVREKWQKICVKHMRKQHQDVDLGVLARIIIGCVPRMVELLISIMIELPRMHLTEAGTGFYIRKSACNIKIVCNNQKS